MKLYYTDEKQNKRLISEADTLETLIEDLRCDSRKKFIFIKEYKLVRSDPNVLFTICHKENSKSTGYTIEE